MGEMISDEETLMDIDEVSHKNPAIKPNFYFQHLVDDIFVSINHDFSTTVLVWCHKAIIPPDYLVSRLHHFGCVVDVQDRWTQDKWTSGKWEWSGCAVTYKSLQIARQAATHLPGASRNIKSMLLQTFINFIIMAEVKHSTREGFCSKLQMERFNLPKTDVPIFRKVLDQFGEVLNVLFFSLGSEGYDKCVVTYRYVAQAYAAHFAMHGKKVLNFRPVAKVIETKTEAQVFKGLKLLMQHYIDFHSFCD